MPPTTTHTKPPSANPERPEDVSDAKSDSALAKSDGPADGLYVIVVPLRESGGQAVELHSAETAESRVSALTYGSKQHRKEAEENEVDVPEGGGNHEINRKDLKVYKLSTSEVTDF